MATAVELPETEPVLKVLRLDAEREMRGPEATRVVRGSAGLSCPELSDLHQMGRPVLDVSVEDRAEDLVLAHIGIEVAEQFRDPVLPADTFVKGHA